MCCGKPFVFKHIVMAKELPTETGQFRDAGVRVLITSQNAAAKSMTRSGIRSQLHNK